MFAATECRTPSRERSNILRVFGVFRGPVSPTSFERESGLPLFECEIDGVEH